MNAWVPFFQSLLWPLVLVSVLLWLRPLIKRIAIAIAARIEQGDSFEAGTGGVKLESAHTAGAERDGGKSLIETEDLPHQIYLVHNSRRAKDLDKNEREFYRLLIWVDADESEMLQEISSVTYHLHPTFREPVREITAKFREPNQEVAKENQQFMLATTCWGEFNMYAEVHFKDGRVPLCIERYIDL